MSSATSTVLLSNSGRRESRPIITSSSVVAPAPNRRLYGSPLSGAVVASEPHGARQRPPQRAPTNRRKQGRLDVSPSLQRVKLGVEAGGGDQLLVGSLLNNPT